MNQQFFLKNLWRWKCGLPDIEPQKEIHDYKALEESEWSDEFENLMRNRLILGAMRYGKLHAHGKPEYDRIESAHNRLQQYEKTGNIEHLVDVANMMLLEFEEGMHPNKHFKPIDDGIHTKIKN